MNLEQRVNTLEAVKQVRNSALPLLNYRWTGPELSKLAFMLEGGKVIERLPEEADDAYQARALEFCRVNHRGRSLPMLQTNKAYLE